MIAKVSLRFQHSFGCYSLGFYDAFPIGTRSERLQIDGENRVLERHRVLQRAFIVCQPVRFEKWGHFNLYKSFHRWLFDVHTHVPTWKKSVCFFTQKFMLRSHPFASTIGSTHRTHRSFAARTLLKYVTKAETKGLKGLWVPQDVLFRNNSIHLKLFFSGYPGIWISPP